MGMKGTRVQVNKPHKSRFSSKSSCNIYKTSSLKDHRAITISKTERNVGKGARAARIQRNKMIREQKRAAVLKQKRELSGSASPPRIIVLFALCASVDLKSLADDLLSLLSKDSSTVLPGPGTPTVASSEYRTRISVLKAPHGDLLSCMEMVKVADLLVFVASARSLCEETDSHYIDSFGNQCLSVFRSLGLPSTVLFVRLIHKVDAVCDGISDKCTLLLTGYLCARSLSVNQLVHISGAGDFRPCKIEVLEDPFLLNSRKNQDLMDSDETHDVKSFLMKWIHHWMSLLGSSLQNIGDSSLLGILHGIQNNPRNFNYDSFKRTQKHVLAKALELEQENREDCIPVGSYTRLHIMEVPSAEASKLCMLAKTNPVTACGLLEHECEVYVLHFSVKKHETYHAPIKSKEELIFNVGFRQFVGRPIFSSEFINANKNKMERFLHAGRFSVASVYAPISFTPLPTIILKRAGEDAAPAVAAFGSLKTVDRDRIILKRVILKGYPQRVSKRKASVKHTFYNPEDVRLFKHVELYTKRIEESVGTHDSSATSVVGGYTNFR